MSSQWGGGEAALGSSTGPDEFADDTSAGVTTVAPGVPTTSAGGGTSGGDDVPVPRQPPNAGECCEVAEGVGCGDLDVMACVCAVDAKCCTHAWDALCVDHVTESGCGACGVGPAGTDSADCCSAHPEPWCADVGVAQCVCAIDPYCCEVGWDQLCVDQIAQNGCGACEGPVAPADCCTPARQGGCPDPGIAECVCSYDPYCCETQWDELCIDEASSYCGGCGGDASETGGPVDLTDCCAAGVGPSCTEPDVAQCVCEIDAFCCEQLWDAVCVLEVETLGCGVCEGAGGSTGGSDTGTGTMGASTGASY